MEADAAGIRRDEARVVIAVALYGFAHLVEQFHRTGEQFGGISVRRRGHQHVHTFEGKRCGGESNSARLAATAVGFEDGRVSFVSKPLQRGDGLGLVGRETRPIGRRGKVVVGGRRRGRLGVPGGGVHDPIALYGVRIHVCDGNAPMGTKRRHETAAEMAGDRLALEWRDSERRVEVVSSLGPLVEWRGEQDEQAAAVDRARRGPYRVRAAFVVTVQYDGVVGGTEESADLFRFDAGAVERVR